MWLSPMSLFRGVSGELEIEIKGFGLVSTAVWKTQKLFPSSVKLQWSQYSFSFNLSVGSAFKWLFISLSPGSTEMVSAMLEAGCDTSVKMGIPATVTPVNLATDLGLEDIIDLLSKASISWQFCQFSLSCCFISWNTFCTAKIIGQLSLITCVQSPIPLWKKKAERAPFQVGEAPVVVVM